MSDTDETEKNPEQDAPSPDAHADARENASDDGRETAPETGAAEAASDPAAETAADESLPTGDIDFQIGDVPENEGLRDPEQVIAELNEQILRLAAEIENTRRRAERDKSDALRYGVTGFARDMVSVGDNLNRALNAIEETDREGLSENMANLLEGVGATQRDLMAALQRNGVKPLTPEGEKFDPNFHEAVYEAPGTGQPAGTVIEVVEIGYMIGDRLLRPAKVGVAKDG